MGAGPLRTPGLEGRSGVVSTPANLLLFLFGVGTVGTLERCSYKPFPSFPSSLLSSNSLLEPK